MDLFRRGNDFYENENDGPIRYIDGSALDRPTSIPLPFKAIMAVFVVIAGIIGFNIWNDVNDEVVNAPVREAEATQTNITREVDYGFPIIKDLIQLDDATIMQIFADNGYSIYNLNSADESGMGFDVIKLPPDVSTVDAALMYSQGVSNLSSSEAALLLNGSWRFTVGRSGYTDANVKYADFSSGGVDQAVQNAIINQGLAETALGESGIDGAGNTFQEGQIDVNGVIYTWRVSSCPLSEVYSVSGLPESAAYVGVRMY